MTDIHNKIFSDLNDAIYWGRNPDGSRNEEIYGVLFPLVNASLLGNVSLLLWEDVRWNVILLRGDIARDIERRLPMKNLRRSIRTQKIP